MDNETPAAKAVRLLGVKAIAQRCDLTTDAVYKWPRRDGGLIPARYQRAVVTLAAERGVEFGIEDVVGAV
jgi:hypothetical protein